MPDFIAVFAHVHHRPPLSASGQRTMITRLPSTSGIKCRLVERDALFLHGSNPCRELAQVRVSLKQPHTHASTPLRSFTIVVCVRNHLKCGITSLAKSVIDCQIFSGASPGKCIPKAR